MYTPPMAPYMGTIPLPIVPTPAVMREGYPTPPDTPPQDFQTSLFPAYNNVSPYTSYPTHQAGVPQNNGHAHNRQHGPIAPGNGLGLYFPNGNTPPIAQQQQPAYRRPVAPTSPEHPYSISPADAYWREHFGANSRSPFAPAPTMTPQASQHRPTSSSSPYAPSLQGVRYEEAPVVPLFPSSSSHSFYGAPRDDAYGPAASSHGSSRRYRQEEGDSGDEGNGPRNGRRKRVRWAENDSGSRAWP